MQTKLFGWGMIVALALATVSFAAPKDETFTGEISDSQCAKNASHEMMLKKECMGATDPAAPRVMKMCGKYVLFNAAKKTVYQLDDKTKPAEFAGAKVTVTGTLDNATKTIHVRDIKAAS